MSHRVFISYHHDNDQNDKNRLVEWAKKYDIFVDWSVDINEIPDYLTDLQIREIIRDEYLQDCRITIILVGTETKNRKHVDWEIFSSMFDGKINKKSGIIVINLPTINCPNYRASHDGEKENVFPENTNWATISERKEFEQLYPFMPDRIIDNLINYNSRISIINWEQLTPKKLEFMIEKAFEDKDVCIYDLSRSMKRRNT